MSSWNPYAPDYNPPPGIPKGFPYAPNPNIFNPMAPSAPGYPPYSSNANVGSVNQYPGSYPSGNSNNAPYPSGIPTNYPGANASHYPPSVTTSYPGVNASPYPPSMTSSYPGVNTSPYPPSVTTSYPGVNASPYAPSVTNSYPGAIVSPYPQLNSPYPPSGSVDVNNSHYPNLGTNLPPSRPPNSSSYPNMTAPYPSSGATNYPASYSASRIPQTSGGLYATHQSFPSANNSQKNMAYYAVGEGTVKPYGSFDPKQDAEVLRKAMKGFGTDEKAIINVLANRSNSQRVYIGVAFKQLYGKDLIDDLKSELNGNFERVILSLMMATSDYLTTELHGAISGIGTDEDVLVEVLCTRTNQEVWSINEAYQRLYGKSLESDIKGDTSGHFQRLLVSACTGARSEAPPDSERAKQAAQALYEAGAAQWGTDESTFNAILVSESFSQLAHTFYEYQKLTGKTVVQAIESEMSGDLKKGMLAIAKCVENKPFYFAEKLYKSMKGLGTDDNTLIRVVVSRCEIDMVQIKAEYERNYNKPLADAIADDTSGDYKRVLISLVN